MDFNEKKTVNTLDLVKNIRSYLNRDPSDLSDDVILMFLNMVTGKLNTALKQHEKMRARAITTLAANNNLVCMPNEVIQLIALHEILPDKQLRPYAQTYISGPYNPSGITYYFVDRGNTLEIFPIPKENISLVIDYYAALPSLTINDSNWVMASYPDCYLYGAFVEAAIWLKDRESMALWQSEFENRLANLVSAGWAGHHITSPVIRTV